MPDQPPATALRAVDAADDAFLYRLYASTRAAEMAQTDWSDAQKEEFLRMQFRAQTRFYADQFTDASFDIIELDGEPIGRLYVVEGRDEINIIDIALLEAFRGRGIGRRYLESILARAVELGCDVTIHVERNNPAMSLYRRLGFERVEDKGVYWFMRCSPSASDQ